MLVILSKNAARNFKRLPKPEKLKIRKKLLNLQENPYIGKKLSGKISGDRSLRAWPYRIIYSINDKAERVDVSEIVHRQGAYKQ